MVGISVWFLYVFFVNFLFLDVNSIIVPSFWSFSMLSLLISRVEPTFSQRYGYTSAAFRREIM